MYEPFAPRQTRLTHPYNTLTESHASQPPRNFAARNIGPDLLFAAATKLVSQDVGDVRTAAKRLINSAPKFGIDLKLLWGVPDGAGSLRQVCLAVPGAGRTSTIFLSKPESGRSKAERIRDRVECLRLACLDLSSRFGDRVQVAQALPTINDEEEIQALAEAGFTRVGNLTCLRRESGPIEDAPLVLPEGYSLRRFESMPRAEELLLSALERSYEETLDCPELCGLRDSRDILESHRATGKFDGRLWWLLMKGEEAHGCVLISPIPDERRYDLVYIGLAITARGRGLARKILVHAMREAESIHGDWALTCAVDDRNIAAGRLYESLGFRAFAQHCAFVRKIAT